MPLNFDSNIQIILLLDYLSIFDYLMDATFLPEMLHVFFLSPSYKFCVTIYFNT